MNLRNDGKQESGGADRRLLLLGLSMLVVCAESIAAAPAFTGLAARADAPDTVASNPAGMSRLAEGGLTIETLLARGIGDFELDSAATSVDGGDPATDHAPILVPFVYYVRPLAERWHGGLAITVPSGFGADYGGRWAGRYYSDYYSLVYVSLTGALSYQVNDVLSLGAAVNVNYTSSESKVAVNNLAPDTPDGRLEAELDGIGTSFTLSALWQATDRTRLGLVYTSKSEAELEGDLKFRNLGPVLEPLLESQGLLDNEIKIDNNLPERMVAGFYHDLDDGRFLTADLLWMKFSEFGTSAVSLNGSNLELEGSGAFDDLWGASLGYGFRTAMGRTWTFGIFHLASPVDDDDRTLSLALDRMWAIGGGVSFARGNGHRVDVNLNVIDYGEGPIDTGDNAIRGRVVGKTRDPYALLLDIAYHL